MAFHGVMPVGYLQGDYEMVKVIKITDCAECPFKKLAYGYNGYEAVCGKTKQCVWGPKEIPDWCPLGDL
jgi:hypothetical protein